MGFPFRKECDSLPKGPNMQSDMWYARSLLMFIKAYALSGIPWRFREGELNPTRISEPSRYTPHARIFDPRTRGAGASAGDLLFLDPL